MRIIKLNTNPDIYSSNAYLLLGDYNKLEDINTLIDTGGDNFIVNELLKINTGAGKKAVSKIILTHNHFDHTGGVKELVNKFNAEVFCYTAINECKRNVQNGDIIKVADSYLVAFHVPGHSHDSICLLHPDSGALFSGDTALLINNTDDTHSIDFFEAFKNLMQYKIKTIYPGHGNPIDDAEELLQISFKNLKSSNIIKVNL